MKYFILISLLFVPFLALTQSTTIEPGSIAPKMTTSERTSITSPQDGMLVFDENTQTYWYRSTGTWVEINGNGSGTPVVPEKLPKVTSKYLALSLPNEDVQYGSHTLEINDVGTMVISYKTNFFFHIVLRRNSTFERFDFRRGNAQSFKLVLNDSDEILMAYDSTDSGHKRLKYRMFDGTTWGAVGIASPNFSDVLFFDLCLNDNSQGFLAWTQPDAVTDRVFVSSYDGSVWTHPSTFFDYFNPDWGNPSNAYQASQVSIGMAANNDALITWKQNTPSSHGYKAEFLSGVWQKPSLATDTIEVAPTAGAILTSVRSKMAENGTALVTFDFFENITFGGLTDSYFYFNSNLKEASIWTRGITINSYVNFFGGSSTSYTLDILPTHTDGMYIFDTKLEDGAFPSGFRQISKVTPTGLISFLVIENNLPTLGYNYPMNVDINSNARVQFAFIHEINSVAQVFGRFIPFGQIYISQENAVDYLHEYTDFGPSLMQSKVSENNRTRAVTWIQEENSIDRLYISLID